VGDARQPGQRFATDVDRGDVWLWRAPLDEPSVTSLSVTWRGSEPVTLRAISLVAEPTGASQPVVVDPRYRLDYLGDLKIYETVAVQPRVFLASGLAVVPNADAAVAALRQPSWDPRDLAVASASDVSPGVAFRGLGAPDSA